MSTGLAMTAARIRELARANLVALLAGVVLLLLAAAAVRWITGQRGESPPRKVMQFTVVNVQPQREPPRPAPPPPPAQAPRQVDEAQPTRTEVRPIDIPPPDAPRPADPGGGRLALAAAGDGSGDAFGLAGNPGGRGLLSGGGLGDGVGAGEGSGAAYAWYSGKIKAALEEALRRSRRLSNASLSGEVRVQVDPTGRVSLLQLLRPVSSEQEEELRSLVGLRLPEPPPPDMPTLIIRISARRPR